MESNFKLRSLNMGMQAGKLRSLFPASFIRYTPNELTWKCHITPSPLSSSYQIRMRYIKGKHPDVYVVSPKLAFYVGETSLPHVYNTSKQWLCLYYRKGREWNSGMLIADTVVPWISEWLYHYELWACTGTWHGGGINHDTESEKQVNKIK